MIWWVIYDISAPKRLRHVLKICRRAGLRQIQKSVYAGLLSSERVVQLREKLLEWVQPEEDRVLMLPISKRDLKRSVSLGVDSGLTDFLEQRTLLVI